MFIMQDDEEGRTFCYATVGEAFSADFMWDNGEHIRLHLVAVRPRGDKVLEHYSVLDFGCGGVGHTLERRAWENYRMWVGNRDVEGISLDKRIIFMLISDKSRIGNMKLKEFSNLGLRQ